MKTWFLIPALLFAVLLMAPRRGETAAVLERTLVHQGRTRAYRVLRPKAWSKEKAVPLVLALHGGGGTAAQMDRSTNGQLGREADKRGWIVVCPQGVAKGWNDGRPLTSRRDRQRKGVDDVAFLGALIDEMHKTWNIDRSRVYATGISNGGFMSFRLGIELSSKIAAIAPVTANLAKVHDGKKPTHPVGLLVINGTADPLVPYTGGHVQVFGRKRGAIHSTDESVKRWAAFNGCGKTSKTVALPDAAPKDGTRAYRSTWSGCGGFAVELIRIQGGGHAWPGGTQYLSPRLVGRVCRDFEATPVIFDFFARHRRLPPKSKKEAPPIARKNAGG